MKTRAQAEPARYGAIRGGPLAIAAAIAADEGAAALFRGGGATAARDASSAIVETYGYSRSG